MAPEMTTEQREASGPDKVFASVLYGAKDLRLVSLPLPVLEPTEVTVAVQATTLCGSDLHYYNHFRNGDILVREPLVLGHESAGVITAVGSAVSSTLKVGDRVALEVGAPCKKCKLCELGRYNLCPEMRFRSSAKVFPHAQGTLQERINIAEWQCFKLPDSVTLSQGALLEPLSVAIHASRRASLPPSSTILIFGAGAVGLLCAAVCKLNSSKKVLISDILEGRLEFAKKHGFANETVLLPLKRLESTDEKLDFARETAAKVKGLVGGEEVDAVFECTGQESCLQSAIYATRPGGRIILVGMGTPIQTLPISAAALREVDLIGSFRYRDTYPEAISIISSGDSRLPDIGQLVTQRFRGLDRVEEAFRMAGRSVDEEGQLVVKVLVEMN